MLDKWSKYVSNGIGLGDFLIMLLSHYLKYIHGKHGNCEIVIWSGDRGMTSSIKSTEFMEIENICIELYSEVSTVKETLGSKRSKNIRRKK